MTAVEPARFTLDPATPDVHGDNERLRAAGALVPVEIEGVRAWAAARYSALEAVLAHPDLSRDVRHWSAEGRRSLCPTGSLAPIVLARTMLNAEGEEHRRLRGPLSRVFSARRVAAMRPRVEAVTAEFTDRLAELPPGPVDLRRAFAYPLPCEVISDVMGIPRERRAELTGNDHVLTTTRGSAERLASARAGRDAVIRETVEARRRSPADDLISDLVALEDGDPARGALSAGEVFDTVQELYVAGHVTTVNLITNAVRLLLARPGRLELLRSGARPWSAAVEEALRLESPLRHFPMRYAVRDVEIGGVTVRKGEAVLACFAAAGRDPDRYGERAARFDVASDPPPHLSFGHGPHFCLGAPLGRLVGEVALSALFAAFPGLALAKPADELAPVPSVLALSTTTLPVRLGRRAG
ncbi:cytochrome P450 family protein [Actinomadura opuntiae]|uniref:cytochrome P450 family protein n=1 Tax=Actinomadura sp. OS1-43 TaxID=604315 RepID=UPI00255AD73B|nr:cytochrome P450 [Actinomadura sp. OS1-43]MDL4820738.1 cytochrome P450 [Actinomadura sp. OS1-43]